MIAVVLPSRGLIFSQTADEILSNLKGINHKFFFSHRKPLPACFETPTIKALLDPDITHLWFVEEDMVIPPGTLQAMIDADANAITCDYPITKDGKGAVFYDAGGRVIFCGTGCLLVKKEVFDSLKTPYFTDKIRWMMYNYGSSVKLVGLNNDSGGYGLHDITFCIKLWKAGVIIKTLPAKLAQRRLINLGKAGSNDGAHNIEIWNKLVKNKRLKELQAQPIASGATTKLVSVMTPTGEMQTSQTHANKLVAKGLGHFPPKSYTIIDDSEVQL